MTTSSTFSKLVKKQDSLTDQEKELLEKLIVAHNAKDVDEAIRILKIVNEIGAGERMQDALSEMIKDQDEIIRKKCSDFTQQQDNEYQALVKFKEIAKEYGLDDVQTEQAYGLIIAATDSNINDDDGVELANMVLEYGDDVVERMLGAIYEFENRHVTHGIVCGVLQNAKSARQN